MSTKVVDIVDLSRNPLPSRIISLNVVCVTINHAEMEGRIARVYGQRKFS